MELVEKISRELGLTFISKSESKGNVCLANSDELRSEFRETFNATDLLNYMSAILNSANNKDKNKAFLALDSIPKDRSLFWNLVALGNDIRKKR